MRTDVCAIHRHAKDRRNERPDGNRSDHWADELRSRRQERPDKDDREKGDKDEIVGDDRDAGVALETDAADFLPIEDRLAPCSRKRSMGVSARICLSSAGRSRRTDKHERQDGDRRKHERQAGEVEL